ncbi:MAG: protease modulator HflC, partial [Alphaproteobacteria bacterium]
MKRGLLAIVGVLLVVGGITALSAFYVVDEREQVIVLQFGNPKRIVAEPGLYVKLPFVQNTVRYDKRTLSLDPGPRQIPLADQRRVNVDVYVRYRITDPLLFFQRVRTERNFDDRAVAIVESELRNVVGRVQLSNLLSERRDQTVTQIRERVTEQVVPFGTEIVDFRIGRVDLPEETSQAVYNRMRSERERLAREFRAVGEEQSRTIRARADRTAVRTVAEAERA